MLETFPHIHASLKKSTLPGVVEFNLHKADRAPSLLFDMLFTRISNSKNIYVDLTFVFYKSMWLVLLILQSFGFAKSAKCLPVKY